MATRFDGLGKTEDISGTGVIHDLLDSAIGSATFNFVDEGLTFTSVDYNEPSVDIASGSAYCLTGSGIFRVTSDGVNGISLQDNTTNYIYLAPGEQYVGESVILVTQTDSRPVSGAVKIGSVDVSAQTSDDTVNRGATIAPAIIDAGEINSVVQVRSVDDLPEASGGFHSLEDKIYNFTTEIESDAGLDLGSTSPVIGLHRGHCWFVHTGEGTAIKGSDDVIISEIGISAPGGQLLDIGGTSSSELLLQDVYFGVDDHLSVSGTISDLGTIGTFRGPEMRVAGIRDFDSGLTFTGEYGRIYMETKVRDVTASNVTCFEFTGDVSMDSADIANCDFANLQSDTVIFDIADGTTINQVFNYRGNTHDDTVTKANILTGAADLTQHPYWVSDSHPLRPSGVVGQLSLDSEKTVTISTQNEWVQVTGSTTLGDDIERTGETETNGQLQYTGTRGVLANITIAGSFYGSNGDIYEVGIAKNGTVESTSAVAVEAAGQSANVPFSVAAVEDLDENDTLSLQVRNTSGTNDATFTSYNITYLGS